MALVAPVLFEPSHKPFLSLKHGSRCLHFLLLRRSDGFSALGLSGFFDVQGVVVVVVWFR